MADRVLIVEDDYLIGLDVQSMLADAGFETCGPVGCPHQAIGLIGTRKPHAVLLDYNLHGQNAAGVAAALTARGIPFAFMSGYSRDHLPPGFEAVPLIGKPVDATVLVAAVKALLGCLPVRKKIFEGVELTAP
jgi:DNA-binding response OmpR family regulator